MARPSPGAGPASSGSSASWRPSAAAGRQIRTLAPRPGDGAISTSPPARLTLPYTFARPRPLPPPAAGVHPVAVPGGEANPAPRPLGLGGEDRQEHRLGAHALLPGAGVDVGARGVRTGGEGAARLDDGLLGLDGQHAAAGHR